jgi:hypothetical protein
MACAHAGKARVVQVLLDRHGQTYADEAHIRLSNKPSPLFRLLCLSLLLSACISASIGVDASRALADAGWRTPDAMASATWEQRAQTLNRSGYARYGERTSTMLGKTSDLVLDKYDGDLRNLGEAARREPTREQSLLQEFPGIGSVGADIFCREAQLVWEELVPYADHSALAVADDLGLPPDAERLLYLVEDKGQFTLLIAALARCRLAQDAAEIARAAG